MITFSTRGGSKLVNVEPIIDENNITLQIQQRHTAYDQYIGTIKTRFNKPKDIQDLIKSLITELEVVSEILFQKEADIAHEIANSLARREEKDEKQKIEEIIYAN
jgi:hypothetical protein